jgi:hypothetical protein
VVAGHIRKYMSVGSDVPTVLILVQSLDGNVDLRELREASEFVKQSALDAGAKPDQVRILFELYKPSSKRPGDVPPPVPMPPSPAEKNS